MFKYIKLFNWMEKMYLIDFDLIGLYYYIYFLQNIFYGKIDIEFLNLSVFIK